MVSIFIEDNISGCITSFTQLFVLVISLLYCIDYSFLWFLDTAYLSALFYSIFAPIISSCISIIVLWADSIALEPIIPLL